MLNLYATSNLQHYIQLREGYSRQSKREVDVKTNVISGRGDAGIAGVVKAAKNAGVKHFFIEDESSRSSEQILQSL